MSGIEYAIVGGGAIGGTLAYHLARSGQHVTLIDADPEHVRTIRENGLTIERGETRNSTPIRASTPEDFDGRLDRVLLAVKAQATETAARWIATRLSPHGCVVSVQNGFNEPVLAEHIGWPRTVAAFVNLFADVAEPGVVRDGGHGAFVVGEPGGSPISERVRSLLADLRSWGPVVGSDNVEGYLWAKAGFGAMLTATALADEAMAELIDRHRRTMYALTAEVFDVAEAMGISLESFDAFDPAAFTRRTQDDRREHATDQLVKWLRTQSKTRSGIWRDIAVRGRQAEVSTQYATVLDAAEKQGCATPVLRALLSELAEVESDPSTMSERRLDGLDDIAESGRS